MLFQSHGRPPILLLPDELQERLQALRRRQRGSRQRKRDALRQVGGEAAARSHTGPVAGTSSAAAYMSMSDASPQEDEEDWGDAVVDIFQELMEEDWNAALAAAEELPETQLVPWVPPEQPPSMRIPGDLSPAALCQLVWGTGATLEDALRQVDVSEEERPLLRLLCEVAVASGRYVAGSMLTELTTDLNVDPSGIIALARLITSLCAVGNRKE